MHLATQLKSCSDKVYDLLRNFFSQETVNADQVDTHLTRSVELLADFCLRGGKAISPFLLMEAYQIGGGKKTSALLPVMGSVELHHKYLLALDDIADQDDERYGGPTLEYMYRQEIPASQNFEHRARSLAMLDSAYLNALSKKLLFSASFPKKSLLACHQIMTEEMLAHTLAGWKIHYYQNVAPIATVTPDEFIKGLELVTARYKFNGPFKIGLELAGNQSPQILTSLTSYGNAIGTAFQIHDDILGLFGDPHLTGKPIGNDVREGKKTLLILHAYEKASSSEKKFLDSMVGNHNITVDQIDQVRQIVSNTGSLTKSKTMAKKLIEKGIRSLDVLPTSASKDILIELANFVISRQK